MTLAKNKYKMFFESGEWKSPSKDELEKLGAKRPQCHQDIQELRVKMLHQTCKVDHSQSRRVQTA